MTEPDLTIQPDAPPDPAVVASPDPPPDAEAAADVAESEAIEIPTGEKLVPLTALKGVRGKLKETQARLTAAEAAREELAATRQQLAETAPLADAFRALQAAQQQAPPPIPQAPPVDTAGMEELARQLDFYRPDGALDLDRAAKFQAIIDKTADARAQQQVAPLVQQSARDKAAANIQKALRTIHPVNGDAVDPQILQARFAQIAAQPGGIEMLADEQAVKELWLNSYGLYSLTPRQSTRPPAPVVTAPVVSDHSGGAATTATAPALDDKDRRVAKEYGLSEAEYLKIASKMPWVLLLCVYWL